jgi:hypothetical protein
MPFGYDIIHENRCIQLFPQCWFFLINKIPRFYSNWLSGIKLHGSDCGAYARQFQRGRNKMIAPETRPHRTKANPSWPTALAKTHLKGRCASLYTPNKRSSLTALRPTTQNAIAQIQSTGQYTRPISHFPDEYQHTANIPRQLIRSAPSHRPNAPGVCGNSKDGKYLLGLQTFITTEIQHHV